MAALSVSQFVKDVMEWTKQQYNKQYESWMPWVEDQYLKWFTKDNKASYTAKENLSKTKLTNNDQLNTAQDSVNDLAAGQVGQGGLAQPLGDAVSKEGVNRAERGGRDEKGEMAPGEAGGVADGVRGGAESVSEGVKGAGGYLGGWVGGGKK